jgi:hypothetical protein
LLKKQSVKICAICGLKFFSCSFVSFVGLLLFLVLNFELLRFAILNLFRISCFVLRILIRVI